MCSKCPMQLFDINTPVSVSVRTRGAQKTIQTCLTGRQAFEICQQMEDNEFVNSLLTQYAKKRNLSDSQWDWIAYLAESHYRQTLKDRQKATESVEPASDFDAGIETTSQSSAPAATQIVNDAPKVRVLTSALNWHSDTQTFTVEASDLNWKTRLAIVTVESHKTGAKRLFKWSSTQRDNEGEIIAHIYKDGSGLTLEVFND